MESSITNIRSKAKMKVTFETILNQWPLKHYWSLWPHAHKLLHDSLHFLYYLVSYEYVLGNSKLLIQTIFLLQELVLFEMSIRHSYFMYCIVWKKRSTFIKLFDRYLLTSVWPIPNIRPKLQIGRYSKKTGISLKFNKSIYWFHWQKIVQK